MSKAQLTEPQRLGPDHAKVHSFRPPGGADPGWSNAGWDFYGKFPIQAQTLAWRRRSRQS